jgi:uncharacterized surface protein with fasciclin (FAS1) repeats
MKKSILIAAASFAIALLSNNVFAQTQQTDSTKSNSTTTAPPAPTGDVVATLTGASDYSTLVTDIKATNLDADLKGAGPYTVFAPDNAAFSSLPKSKQDSLTKDPTALKTLVVSGKYDKAGVIQALIAGKGTATLKTMNGQTLTLTVKDKKLVVTDQKGNSAEVTSFDTPATNGVIHGINGVL